MTKHIKIESKKPDVVFSEKIISELEKIIRKEGLQAFIVRQRALNEGGKPFYTGKIFIENTFAHTDEDFKNAKKISSPSGDPNETGIFELPKGKPVKSVYLEYGSLDGGLTRIYLEKGDLLYFKTKRPIKISTLVPENN